MKIALKILLIVGVAAYAVFAIIQFSQRPEELVCEAVDIEITQDSTSCIITKDYVQSLLVEEHFSPEGLPLKQTDLALMEEALLADPYIDKVTCFFKANAHLCVRVTPLTPILHVMTDGGEDYYIDTTGVVMPVGYFNLNLCVATGHIRRQEVKEQLIPLAWYIHEDPYWNRQVEQIYVDAKGQVTLIPHEGTHRILLGTTDNFEEKLANMRLFYEEGLPKTGWNHYKEIDLRYKNQVIGRKGNK